MHWQNPDDVAIARILTSVKTIALIGASANIERPAHRVGNFLRDKGYKVVGINPGLAGQDLYGTKVQAKLADVQEPVDMVDIFRNSEAAAEVVDEALKLKPLPKVIWMQLGVINEAAAAKAKAAGIDVVMDRCPKIEWARLPQLPKAG